MSLQQQRTTVGNRREVNRAAEWIIPDGFVERYDDAETVEAALREAEREPSITPEPEHPRCRLCSSKRITPKPGYADQKEHRTAYYCTHCNTHLDDPVHPADLIDDELTAAIQFFGDTHCCMCNYTAKVYIYDNGVGGAVCMRHIGPIAAAAQGAGNR